MEKIPARETAYPVMIGTLLTGSYLKAEAQFQPSYLKTIDGRLFSRVHIIGVIVSLEDNNTGEAIIDDGTGKLVVRSFENTTLFTGFSLGDVIRVIGKVRAFNEQIYLIPEVIKKITNKQFITLHKLHLQLLQKSLPATPTAIPDVGQGQLVEEEVIEMIVDADETQPVSPIDALLSTIKELDTGEGARIEEILQRTGQENEKIIHHLLEAGDIFEIRPGRIKMLE